MCPAHQGDDSVLSLHLLPQVLEAGQQAVVQRLQLLRGLLTVNTDPVGQERDLQEQEEVARGSHLIWLGRGEEGSRVGGASPAGR